jgi:toxin ParE1/3/4
VKPAALRPLAEDDLVERTRYYRRAGGSELAERFFDAAIAALRLVEESPGVGSPRVGELIGLPGLRRIGVEGFPFGWLYLERPELLDVLRLVADRQDLAAALGEPEPTDDV